MLRRLLTYLRERVATARHARDGPAASWRRHIWRLLAWPIGALVVLGLGWFLLFQQLAAERRQLEREVDAIEQTVRFVKYDWEARQGDMHLGYADERGLFLDASRLLVSVVDAQGQVLTSTAPTVLSPAAVAYILPRVRTGIPVKFLVDDVPAEGRAGRTRRLLFAWELSDRDGRFAAAVVVAFGRAGVSDHVAARVYRPARSCRSDRSGLFANMSFQIRGVS